MLKFTYAVAALALAARTAVADSGKLKIYDGTKPATAGAAAAGTLLATLTLNATAFGAPADVDGDAVATANSIADVTAAADGTPAYFRITEDDDTPCWQGDVGDEESTADLKFADLDWHTGDTVSVSSLQVKEWGDGDPA